MANIECVMNEPLRLISVDHTKGTNLYFATYEETKDQPLFPSIQGVSHLVSGDEIFSLDYRGFVEINNLSSNKIIGGLIRDKVLYLRWEGKPDMVFVDYLIEKKKEKFVSNWLLEGF